MGTLSTAILLPTRNRPQLVRRFVDSVYATATHPERVTVYIYIDDDDRSTPTVLPKLCSEYRGRIKYMVAPRIMMSDMINKLYPMTSEDLLFSTNDDVIMRTRGWDDIVYAKFEELGDRLALVYGEDMYKGSSTQIFLHRRWVETLGYVNPPYFSSDYGDTWLSELATKLNRIYKLPFVTEHMHFAAGKAPMDATYTENRTRYAQDNPAEIYNRTADLRQADLEKLKLLINTPYVKPA